MEGKNALGSKKKQKTKVPIHLYESDFEVNQSQTLF